MPDFICLKDTTYNGKLKAAGESISVRDTEADKFTDETIWKPTTAAKKPRAKKADSII